LARLDFPPSNQIYSFVDFETYLGLDFVTEEGLLSDESLGDRLISLVE
jgi:hypothetical protein